MKTVVLTLNFDSDNPDLPIFNALSLFVGRHDNTTRSRSLVATGGTIVLPEGMVMSDNLLPESNEDYSFVIKNISNVTALTMGSDITNFRTEWLEQFPALQSFYTRSSASSEGNDFILTGNTSFVKYCPNLTYFRVGTPVGLTGNITDFSDNLLINDIGFAPINGGGEWLDFVAKQISKGRTSASIVSYYCQTVKFNGGNTSGQNTISWSNVSSNIYDVSFTNKPTVRIAVNNDGTYTIVT